MGHFWSKVGFSVILVGALWLMGMPELFCWIMLFTLFLLAYLTEIYKRLEMIEGKLDSILGSQQKTNPV